MEKSWVKVFESSDDMKIGLARQYLEDNDIESVVVNKKDRVYLWGDIELYVNRDCALAATTLIKKLQL